MITRDLIVSNDLGLHLRAAGVLARVATRFQCEVSLRRDTHTANAKSIMSVLALAAATGTELELVVDGPDEDDAAREIELLFVNGFESK